ncbi:DUF2911 domain-containing protein [Emticicia sp. BO119]|uniref:DUF2911 domain-containing protein n=1 Tax=Emticicia sp. BO119 TaxID=2757768 RepID=UPI0015F0A667|nr:DUF2911 domain-containing protein [Emticicia sp. BO119]MBA4852218.1 DUF2911 domain-containing protein [Emticicia sp. BO119]
MTKTVLLAFALLSAGLMTYAQGDLTSAPDGGNKKATVSEQIGLVNITITYGRPGVKGREGKIWGTPVAHYGLVDLGFGTSKAAPWRAGANENTTISFSNNVKIEGKDLAAGTYGFHIILGETDNILIFSKANNSWGSFYYDPVQDALRVNVKSEPLEKSVEWLKYEFMNQTDNSATIALLWEKRMIPFKVDADVNKIQLASFRNELHTKPGFKWESFVQAANFCLQNNIELEQALAWADEAITARFVGQKNFQTLSTKAAVLARLNRMAEAKAIMDEAVPMGSMIELHQYGRRLIGMKQPQEALKVFKTNYDKNPNVFTTNVGLGRGYSANGDYKKALEYLRAALAQAPDDLNKNSVEAMIKKLEEGKDVN